LQKIIGRKKTRDSNCERNLSARYEEIWSKIENCQTSQKGEKLKEIEVRLVCDIMNEDMKKSFNKTVKINNSFFENFFLIYQKKVFFRSLIFNHFAKRKFLRKKTLH